MTIKTGYLKASSRFFDNPVAFYTFAAQFLNMHKTFFKTWAHISLLAANIIYGVNYSIAKAVMPDQIKPLALVALRSISAAGLFWLTSIFLPKEKVSRKDFSCQFFNNNINKPDFCLCLCSHYTKGEYITPEKHRTCNRTIRGIPVNTSKWHA
jgi:hypothetical protein